MYLRKYPDHIFVLILSLMYLTNIQSMRKLYAYLLDGRIKINNLPSRQTIHYRLKRLSKKKVSKKLKRLFSTLLVIDSSEIRGKKKRLHLLYEAKEKVLLDFEIGNNKEVEHAEVMLEDIEGSILLADRGYWQWEFIEKMKEKMKLYVRPRGRKGEEFMEREINRLIYSKRWEIEWYIERLKQRIKMRGMNERTLKAQITYMLLG
ncbi:transposase [Thermosipho globiformans]|uniref:transposase n=1 Tax=Thermosipho globiformans TaxID=380685 RepID=UPI001F498BDB|nr:transposase [Thermosipho globiformans]